MNTDNSTPETVTIQLTQGQFAIIDFIDADLARFKWNARLDRKYANGGKYMVTRSIVISTKKHKTLLIHRVILERMLERSLLKGEMVDHINGDPLDNRRENLRLATCSQNQHNVKRRSDNTSGFKGVYFATSQKKWAAKLYYHKKQYWLGYFDTPEEAHAAYCEAARKHHGEFANFG